MLWCVVALLGAALIGFVTALFIGRDSNRNLRLQFEQRLIVRDRDFRNAEERAKRLDAEFNNTLSKLRAAESEHAKLELQLTQERAALRSAKDSSDDAARKLAGTAVDVDELRRELRARDDNHGKVKAQLADERKSIESATAQLNSLRSQLATSEKERERLNAALTSAQESNTQGAAGAVRRENDLKAAQNDIAQELKRAAALKLQVQQLEATTKQQAADLKVRDQQLAVVSKPGGQDAALRAELADVRAEAEAERAKFQVALAERGLQQSGQADAQAEREVELKQLREAALRATEQAATDRAKRLHLEAELAALQGDREGEQTVSQRGQRLLNQAERDLGSRSTEVSSVRAALNRVDTQNERLTASLQALLAELDMIRPDAIRAAQLEAEVDRLSMQLQVALRTAGDQGKALKHTQTELNLEASDAEKRESQLAAAIRVAGTQAEQLRALRVEVQDLRAQLGEQPAAPAA